MAKQSRNASDSFTSKKPDRPESTGSTGSSETRPGSASASGSPTVTADQPTKTRKARREPTMEDIQARAYKIFLSRNGAPGDPESDWLQAERELREESNR
ncbi:MAG: DUF2934 domain-containing protein [Phycisphaerae bacterium]|nr:DUF2934 domain-containing protein [Phycisphaerae bacterium]